MVYLWRIPEFYKNRDIGEYDRENSSDRFLLLEGRNLTMDEYSATPVVNFQIPKKKVLQFDCLPNDGADALVSLRVKKILETIAPNDVQFFKARLICKDGELNNYYFLNVTHTVSGIDHEKSSYTKMKMADAISRIHYLTYKPDCMQKYDLARDEEYKVHLLVSEKIKQVFDNEKITGVWLVRPEDYYRGPLTAEDLINDELNN